ncbi:MAG: 4'-phosphopantetheinyl transferase superfamily protein [Alistipes communis]
MARRRIPRTGCRADRLRRRGRPRADRRSAPYRRLARGRARGRRDLRPPLCGRHRVETRRFTRAAAHFLTPAEAALGDDPRVAGVVWCAKETLYKLARRRGLDLLRDLAIERIDFAAGEVVGRIRGGEPIPMRLELREGLIVVHTL